MDFSSYQLAADAFLQLISVKPMSAAKSTPSSSLITLLMSQPFLELFEIDAAFPLEEYISHSSFSEGFIRAPGISSVSLPSESHSTDNRDFVIDQAYISRPSASTDYLNWQFEVGGQVAVAYAINTEDSVGREGSLTEWDIFCSRVPESTEDTHPTSVISTSNSTYDHIAFGVERDAHTDRQRSIASTSGAFGGNGGSGEYKRLVLTPRTLPPPLPPVQSTKPRATAWSTPRKAVKADEKSEPKAGNMFDSLGSSDDDDDDNSDQVVDTAAPVSDSRSHFETEWTCAHCTFINQNDNGPRICIMCENFTAS